MIDEDERVESTAYLAKVADIYSQTFAIEFLDPGVQAYAFTFG